MELLFVQRLVSMSSSSALRVLPRGALRVPATRTIAAKRQRSPRTAWMGTQKLALAALLLLQLSTSRCAPLRNDRNGKPIGDNDLTRILALEMQLKNQETQLKAQEAERLKQAAKVLELEDRLKVAERGPSQSAAVPFEPGQRRRAQALCNFGFKVNGDKDPHFSYAHGGRADFRGRNGRGRRGAGSGPLSHVLTSLFSPPPRHPRRAMYCFHSAPGYAVNIKTEDATFKLHKGALTVDGSFITEVHFVAETGREEGELVHATFWANELKCVK